MYNRYMTRIVRVNESELYEEFLVERGVKKIKQYLTPHTPKLTRQRRAALETSQHLWKTGDRLCKLAAKYYGDSTLWWLIAWYNEKPTDAHYKIGSIVYIPTPLGRVLSYYNTAVVI